MKNVMLVLGFQLLWCSVIRYSVVIPVFHRCSVVFRLFRRCSAFRCSKFRCSGVVPSFCGCSVMPYSGVPGFIVCPARQGHALHAVFSHAEKERDTEQPQEKEPSQNELKAPIFLEAVSAIEIMQEPQSNLEEKVNPSILKDDFSSKTDPSIFTSIRPLLLDQSNKTS